MQIQQQSMSTSREEKAPPELSDADISHHRGILERIKETYGIDVLHSVKEHGGYRIPCPSCKRTQCWDTCTGQSLTKAINKDYAWCQKELEVTDEKIFTTKKKKEEGIMAFLDKYKEFLNPDVNLFKALKKDGTYSAVTKRAADIAGMIHDYINDNPVCAMVGERALKQLVRFQWAEIEDNELVVLSNAMQSSDPNKYSSNMDELALVFDALSIIESFLLLKSEKEQVTPDAVESLMDVEKVTDMLAGHFISEEDGNKENTNPEENEEEEDDEEE